MLSQTNWLETAYSQINIQNEFINGIADVLGPYWVVLGPYWVVLGAYWLRIGSIIQHTRPYIAPIFVDRPRDYFHLRMLVFVVCFLQIR